MSAAASLIALAGALLSWPATASPRSPAPSLPGGVRVLSVIRNWHLGIRERLAVGLTGTLLAALVAPPHAALCAGVVGLVLATVIERARERRRSTQERAADCDTLLALAAELRAGHDLAGVLRATARAGSSELSRALGRAGHAITMGEPPGDAIERATASPLGLQLAGVIRLSSTHGIALAEAVDVLAGDASDALRQQRDLAGLLAGPRSTAALLAVLPLFGIVMGESIGAHPMQTLLHTGAGALVMVVGVVLAALGVLWTQSLVAKAES